MDREKRGITATTEARVNKPPGKGAAPTRLILHRDAHGQGNLDGSLPANITLEAIRNGETDRAAECALLEGNPGDKKVHRRWREHVQLPTTSFLW